MVPYAPPRSSSKMAKVILLVAAILVWFVEFKQTMGFTAIENNTVYTETPSCCQVTVGGNGQGTITVTAPAINSSIVESSQLLGACLINASASKNNYIICTHFKAATSSAADCVSHYPPNSWCQDNVMSLNFTKLLNGSGLLFATILVSNCHMKLGLSLRGSGIHSFKAGVVCQYDCTSVASGQENLSTQSTSTIPLSSSANGSTSTVASGQENLSTSANGSTGTDESALSSIWIAVGIGCPALVLALLVAFLVCKKRTSRSRIKSSGDTSSTELTNTSVTHQQQE